MSEARDFCLLVGPGPRAYSPKSSQSGSLPILYENGYNSLSPLLHYIYVYRLASATSGPTFQTGSERTRAVFLNRSAPRIAVAKCQTLLWTNDREIHKKSSSMVTQIHALYRKRLTVLCKVVMLPFRINRHRHEPL